MARLGPGPAGPAGIVVAGAGHELALELLGAGGLAVLGLMLGHAALERALRAGGGAFAAIALALALIAVVAFAVAVVALGILLGLAEIEVEIVNELARDLGVGFLVGDVAVELDQVAADLALEERPPHLDHALRRRRHARAGERLARQQPHRLGQGRVVALGEVLIALPAVALIEHGGEVAGDAGHAPGAQRLDPRLLDAFEDGARGLAAGQARAHGARRRDSAASAPPHRRRRAPVPPR